MRRRRDPGTTAVTTAKPSLGHHDALLDTPAKTVAPRGRRAAALGIGHPEFGDVLDEYGGGTGGLLAGRRHGPRDGGFWAQLDQPRREGPDGRDHSRSEHHRPWP